MIRGLYTAASGMLLNEKRSTTIDQNLENIHTPGYRQAGERVVSFPRLLVNRLAKEQNTGQPEVAQLGIMGTGVYADRMLYKQTMGNLRETGNRTDLALTSEGYFAIETVQGERYTRNGHFQLDPSGFLRTAGGNLVLGLNGPIGPLPEDFKVEADGTIRDKQTNQILDRLMIVDIPAESLQRDGLTTLYRTDAQAVLLPAENIQIEQGFVEESNVDLNEQMVKMLEVVRAYSANQKVIQTNDSLLQKAVNEIAKV